MIELLIVLAIVAFIATVVFIALDPAKRFADSRNAKRQEEIKSIVDAVNLYTIKNGAYPAGIDDSLRMLGTASSGCEAICGQTVAVIDLPVRRFGFFDNLKNLLGGQSVLAAGATDEAEDINKPNIISASVLPTKVWPGQTMTIRAEIEDAFGLTSVKADMGGIETIDLNLQSGDQYHGIWEATWLVHDTELKDYLTIISALNSQQALSKKELLWSDPLPTGWISPSSYSDPGNQWDSETLIYDGDSSSYGRNTYGSAGWGQFIILNMASTTLSDRLRVKADYLDSHIREVDIDIYRDGAWVDVFQGGSESVWNGKFVEVPYAKGNVSQVRFRYNYSNGGYYFWVYELQVYRTVADVALPTCTAQNASAIQKTAAVLRGLVADDGGEICQYRFNYGKTSAYGSSTTWSGSVITGDMVSQALSGLDPGTEYHFQTQIKNSAGTADCADVKFSTKVVDSGWLLPTSFNDPDNAWDDEINAGDDMTSTFAGSYHDIGDPLLSSFIYLGHEAVAANAVKFLARGGGEVSAIDVDVFKNGVWENVYDGSVNNLQWQEITFAEGLVSNLRIRFATTSSNSGFFWELYEVAIRKSTATSDASCLNLEAYLVPDYLPKIPYDPLDGNDEKTYYAIRRKTDKSISVVSCHAEDDKYLEVIR